MRLREETRGELETSNVAVYRCILCVQLTINVNSREVRVLPIEEY